MDITHYTNITLKDTCSLSQKIYKGLRYDALVPIDELHENKYNLTLYKNWSKYHGNYINELASLIEGEGLQKVPIVFSDVLLLIGGHHRKRSLKHLGVSHVPVRVHDKDYTWEDFKDKPVELMKIMANDNMRPEETEYDKFCALQAFIKSHKSQFNVDTVPVNGSYGLKVYGSTAGFSYKKYCKYKTLVDGDPSRNLPPRPELWNDIVKGNKSLAWASKTQKSDANRDLGLVLPKLPCHDNLITTDMVKPILGTMKGWMNKMLNISVDPFNSGDIYPGKTFDAAALSTLCHNYVTKVLPAGMLKLGGIKAEAPDDNSHMDIKSPAQDATNFKPFDIETKHNIGSTYWTSGSEKIGYHILVSSNDTFEMFWVGFVYIPENTWTLGAHGPKKLHLSALQGLDVKVLHGSLITNKEGKLEIFRESVRGE